MNKNIKIGNGIYQLKREYKDGFSKEVLEAKWTDYFEPYDYIVGDYAYDKLRLKGFCNPQNEKFSAINDKKQIDKYIKEECAYECRYFILEKIDPK